MEISENLKKNRFLYAAAVWCVVLALVPFYGEWVYQLSHWGVCGIALWCGWQRWKEGVRGWLVPLGIVAVLFNPIAPINFARDEWVNVDWIAAVVFLITADWNAGWVRMLARGIGKITKFLWREFARAPEEDEDPINWLGARILLVFVVGGGLIIGWSAWEESTPEGRIRVAKEQAKWAALKAEREEKEKIKSSKLTGYDPNSHGFGFDENWYQGKR